MTRRHRGPREASVPGARSSGAALHDRRHRRFRSIRGHRTLIMRRQRWRSPAIALTWRPTTATTSAVTTTTTTMLAVTTTIISTITALNERCTSKNEEKSRRRRDFHPRVRQHSGRFRFLIWCVLILMHNCVEVSSKYSLAGTVYNNPTEI